MPKSIARRVGLLFVILLFASSGTLHFIATDPFASIIAKGETGLDHCEARSLHGWHRHMTQSMLALAFLAGLRARLKEAQIGAASGTAT